MSDAEALLRERYWKLIKGLVDLTPEPDRLEVLAKLYLAKEYDQI